MVWTRETGILDVAVELRRCPPIWKAARGSVVMRTCFVGFRIGCLRTVNLVLRTGKMVASQARNMHSDETNANWMMVRVAGLSKAFKMDFDDVLVMAEDAYHITQRNYSPDISITVSIGGAETGRRGRIAYDELWGDWRAQSISNFVSILANAATAMSNMMKSFRETLLSTMASSTR